MKRALAVLLCAVLLLGLAGCGKTDDANLGTYNCISVKLNGAELGTEGEYIELKAGESYDESGTASAPSWMYIIPGVEVIGE